MKRRLQVCVDCVESAVFAQQAGATDIELCGNLHIGGTTPSIALYEEVKRHVDIPIYVLIRPRYGDFLYDIHEMNMMKREIELFCNLGAKGVVIGALKCDGDIDFDFIKSAKKLVKDTSICIHRVFDCCKNPLQAYNTITQIGCEYILTTGQKNDVLEGIELLNSLSSIGGTELLVGCSNASKLKILIKNTQISSFHLSGKILKNSLLQYKNEVEFAVGATDGYSKIVTDKSKIIDAYKVIFK